MLIFVLTRFPNYGVVRFLITRISKYILSFLYIAQCILRILHCQDYAPFPYRSTQ